MNDEPVDLKKHNVSYIFQENSTMPWLTVEENIGFGLDIKKVPEKLKKERVEEFMEIVGLTEYRKFFPCQLSASMLSKSFNCQSICYQAGPFVDG